MEPGSPCCRVFLWARPQAALEIRAHFVHDSCMCRPEFPMNAVMKPRGSLAEALREPDQVYLSPRRIGDALGLPVQSLAERARVSRNTPTARPQNEHLQQYLRDVVRVIAAAEDAAGGDRTRAIFWLINDPLAEFDYLTADALVQAGKAQVVIDYIESIAGGATG